jgi:hypothetical protein
VKNNNSLYERKNINEAKKPDKFFNNDKCNRICFNVFIWWAQGLFQPTDIHTKNLLFLFLKTI